MRCPFPGMDPYLEKRSLWEDVHNSLIGRVRDAIAPVLDPRYYVAVEERVLLLYGGEGATDEPLVKPDLTISEATRQPAPPPSLPPGQEGAAVAVRVRLPVPERVRETFLEIRTPEDETVVTVIEVLSMSNKLAGEQRSDYLRERGSILASGTNLVEIDLLRAGRRMPIERGNVTSHYAILLSRVRDPLRC